MAYDQGGNSFGADVMPIRPQQKNPPGRKTIRMFQKDKSAGLIKTSGEYPALDPRKAFERSINVTKKIPIEMLRAATHVAPVRRAIRRICNGVLEMPFQIKPPEDLMGNDKAIAQADAIKEALFHPNDDEHDTYRKFIYAMVSDLLIMGYAVVERSPVNPEKDDPRPFRLWLADPAKISLNPDWTPDPKTKDKVPRFYDMSQADHLNPVGEPFMYDEMFIIQEQASSYTLIPPSPVETAFMFIANYMGLVIFQAQTTGGASSEYALDLGDVSLEELDAFRRYYEDQIAGSGKKPIFAGRGQANILKFGANSDSGLYLGYHDVILKAIAMSFGLTPRDMGITEHDNRATAGAAADSGFQDAILPLAKVIMESLQLYVVDFFFPGYRIQYIDTEPRTQEQESSLAIQLYEKQIITFNEARGRCGMEEMDDGDHFVDGRKFGEPLQAQAPPDQPPPGGGESPQPSAPTPKKKEKPPQDAEKLDQEKAEMVDASPKQKEKSQKKSP